MHTYLHFMSSPATPKPPLGPSFIQTPHLSTPLPAPPTSSLRLLPPYFSLPPHTGSSQAEARNETFLDANGKTAKASDGYAESRWIRSEWSMLQVLKERVKRNATASALTFPSRRRTCAGRPKRVRHVTISARRARSRPPRKATALACPSRWWTRAGQPECVRHPAHRDPSRSWARLSASSLKGSAHVIGHRFVHRVQYYYLL